jgi:HEAT repeat protein
MRTWLGGLGVALGLVASVFGADVAEMVKQLKDPDADARRAAAKALADAGGDARAAVPALVAALKDKDLYVRRFAAQALGQVGASPGDAVTALKAALNDPHREVQEAAAASLAKMGPAAAAALAAVAREADREPEVRRRAVESLGALGRDARAALPVLVQVLKGTGGPGKKMMMGGTADVRVAAATALGNIARSSDKEAVAALQSMTDKKQRDRSLRQAAQMSLQKIKSGG